MFRRVLITTLKRASVRPAVRSWNHVYNSPVTTRTPFRLQSTASIPLEKQQLMLSFTCQRCDTRSSHTISKQAYTKGTVLVKCPGCDNRHLIADHLKIFKDDHFTIEQLMEVSKSTDDLVFEEIPEKLKGVLGYYAKDSPKEYKNENGEEDGDEIKFIK